MSAGEHEPRREAEERGDAERREAKERREAEERGTGRGEERDERPATTADLAAGPEGEREERRALLADEDADRLRARWSEIQARFVDEPRDSVAEADTLVAELMQRLAKTFAAERETLERQWDSDGDVSTEDLRVALQRYRSFFDRLLSA